jgi:hypothetical protein
MGAKTANCPLVSWLLKGVSGGLNKQMKKLILTSVFALMLSMGAKAVPDLQLDISGGVYNTADETIYNSSDAFSLYALAKTGSLTGTTYYLSIAVVPKQSSGSTLPGFGSFVLDGTTYNAGSGWVFGTPPADAAIANIPSHSMFPTLYLEIAFSTLDGFANEYNSEDSPGGFSIYDGSGPKLGYEEFTLNTANLGANYALHFDLYTYSPGDNRVDAVAPFSHDAQTRRVPDGGASAILLGTALAGVGLIRRYFVKA